MEQIRHIYEKWHEYAKSRNTDGLLSLYADNAVFESPLVPAILDDKHDGVLQGKPEIARFIKEGTKRRPNELVRWFRTGEYLTDGRILVWEYPRQTDNGEQIDILELMEIENGLILKHRIYWGWKGCMQISTSLLHKAR
ncbi:nuclear transport factor 2 family protein [Necropsobacter rosorum]|uniref:nuclear transport factor 2 family protein n=1 Tax=Necropsobacter rosorum TaxID=908285 RepID=UPI000509BBB3